jgi:hypothetical protein
VKRRAKSNGPAVSFQLPPTINETNSLDEAAIIDWRGSNPGLFHDAYGAFAIRARLDREHRTAASSMAVTDGRASDVELGSARGRSRNRPGQDRRMWCWPTFGQHRDVTLWI